MISVVMTVHNEDFFLYESLKSLSEQITNDIEFICIDDASDNPETRKFLNDFSKIMPIKIIRNDSCLGAAVSRNIGLSVAKGDYILFIDADDIFDKDYLKEMYDAARKNDADMVICGYDTFLEDIHFKKLVFTPKVITNDVDSLEEYNTSAWTKLVRRQLLLDRKIQFQDIKAANDVYFSLACFSLAQNIAYIEKSLVHYRVGSNSISCKRTANNVYEVAMEVFSKLNPIVSKQKQNQLLVKILSLFLGEMNNRPDYNSHIQMKELIEKNCKNVNIYDSIMMPVYENLLKKSYSESWYIETTRYYLQLKKKWQIIFRLLDNKKNIYLWGSGKRGKAFIRLCKENNIIINGIYDKYKPNLPGNIDIVDKEKMFKEADVIVISNELIKNEILKVKGVKIICLSDYS